ncbi:MAG: hypothetical protein R3Y36_07770 [Spirochaetales bacterium]
MIQFYLLSIVLNAMTGLLLVFSSQKTEDVQETVAAGLSFFETKNFRLILGILTVFAGLMKLLSVIDGDIPVIGDILPALAGITGGTCLLYEYFIASSSVEVSLNPVFESIFVKGRKYLGIACITVAVFHFIIPQVLFL